MARAAARATSPARRASQARSKVKARAVLRQLNIGLTRPGGAGLRLRGTGFAVTFDGVRVVWSFADAGVVAVDHVGARR